jgi:cation:H+ antiporter
MEQISTNYLIGILAASAFVIWICGIQLSKVTDFIDKKYNLGDAFGGLIILSIVTNLPEIAIIISGAMRHDLSLASGNILGGIAVQTVVLVILDFYCGKKSKPLSTLASSKQTILEGVLVITILSITIIGSQLKNEPMIFHTTASELLILIIWIVGLLIINNANKKTKKTIQKPIVNLENAKKLKPASAFIWLFITASATLFSGVLMEQTSSIIAHRIHIDGVIFGATILALLTSLPELSTGVASVKFKDYQLATGDIFGGNAFLPVLFLLASLISGENILAQSTKSDMYLTTIGILLTAIYVIGLIVKSSKKVFGIGIDSLVVLILYAFSILGLMLI